MLLPESQTALRRLGRRLLPVLLLGYLLGVHHELAYVHEVCAVDGAITHEDHDHGHSHDHGPAEESHEDGDEHEHCGLPTLGDDGDSPPPSFRLGPAVAAARIDEPRLVFLVRAEEARYRLAPKNSPPGV